MQQSNKKKSTVDVKKKKTNYKNNCTENKENNFYFDSYQTCQNIFSLHVYK